MKDICSVHSDLVKEIEGRGQCFKDKREKERQRKMRVTKKYVEAARKLLFLSTGCVDEDNEMYRKHRLADKGKYPTYIYLQSFIDKCSIFLENDEDYNYHTIHSGYFILSNPVYGDYFIKEVNKTTKEFFGVEYDLIDTGEYTFDHNYYLAVESVTAKDIISFTWYFPNTIGIVSIFFMLGFITFGATWLYLIICGIWYIYLQIKQKCTKLYKTCRSFTELRGEK